MSDHDEALQRMQASDPATGSHPDLLSLRQRIAAKAPASQGADSAVRLKDDTLRGSGLRAPWIAAAAVLAFGFGAGGYALGAQQAPDGAGQLAGQDSGTSTEEGADGEASAARDSGMGMAAEGGDATFGDGSEAPDDGSEMAEGASDMSGENWDPGPVRLLAGPGLPAGRGTGEVRALVSEEDPQEFLDGWSERLGFEGVPNQGEDNMWFFAGSALYDEANGRMLTASADGGSALSFNYEDMLASPWCADMYDGLAESDRATLTKEWTAAFGEGVAFPDPSRCKDVTGSAPTSEQAIAAARDFLVSTGLDVDSYTLEVPEWFESGGDNTVSVEGWPEGQEYGNLNVSFQVGPSGVISAYGAIGEMTSLGEYPTISAVEAVERYGQRAFSLDYGVTLLEDMVGGGDMGITFPSEMEMPEPVTIEPGMRIPMLLKDKTVTNAELVRGTIWAQTAGPLEVPAWKLTTSDGMHYAVLALADEAIEWQSWDD